MIKQINKKLSFLYIGSGYLAAFFLIAVLLFILTGISSRIFGFYIRGLAEYSGYSMAASSFFALSYTFYDKAHIRITLFLEKLKTVHKKIAEIWWLFIEAIFSGSRPYFCLPTKTSPDNLSIILFHDLVSLDKFIADI